MPEVQVVLVEPSHPGNIGGAARAMKTMGLSSLTVVKPKRFPDPQADWRAAGALDIIERTQVCETIQGAVGESVLVAGTSARSRHIPWPMMTSFQFAQFVYANYRKHDRVSILFGREDNGLTNEELNLCNKHVRIPASEHYGSLNLAMSVQVIAYDLFCRSLLEQSSALDTDDWDQPFATFLDINNFLDHLESVLKQIGFSNPTEPRNAGLRLRRLFTRLEMDHTEVQILRGVLTQIEKAITTTSILSLDERRHED